MKGARSLFSQEKEFQSYSGPDVWGEFLTVAGENTGRTACIAVVLRAGDGAGIILQGGGRTLKVVGGLDGDRRADSGVRGCFAVIGGSFGVVPAICGRIEARPGRVPGFLAQPGAGWG